MDDTMREDLDAALEGLDTSFEDDDPQPTEPSTEPSVSSGQRYPLSCNSRSRHGKPKSLKRWRTLQTPVTSMTAWPS